MPVETQSPPKPLAESRVEPTLDGPIGESRVVLRDVGWEGYEAVRNLVGDRPVPRLAYLLGELELMSPGYLHETLAERFGLILHEILLGLGIPHQVTRHVTLHRRDLDRAVEGDKSYYFTNLDRFKGKTEIDLNVDPPPDLVIEVEISRAIADRLTIYAGLGVAEVWTLSQREGLKFLHLSTDEKYVESATSRALPFLRPEDLIPWLEDSAGSLSVEWGQALRAWVRDVLSVRDRRGPVQDLG